MELGVAAGVATYGAAAAATAASVGLGLFNYNRGNYMMDQKLNYERFLTGQTLAVAQTGMYRQDIGDLTSLTVSRMDVYNAIAAMSATIVTALFAPGRMGTNTPAPPGWLMGLFLVNLAGCYMWLFLTIWHALHASLRANSAATHLLTRFVRLPIPASWMLDRARTFLSSYEDQPFREVLRIPFMKHQFRRSKNKGGFNEAMDVEDDAQRRTRHGYDVPAWYRDEKAVNQGYVVESMMPFAARGTAPEHFEAYREIQNEWWPYDVYARLCMFLAFMHVIHSWTYMQLGHHLAETRSLFAAGCVVLPMSVLQQLILTLDIIPSQGELSLQRIGPFAQWFAYVAAAIEYKRWYTPGAAAFGHLLVYVAYGIHIAYTVQLVRLCTPSAKPPAPSEAIGASWWPGSWRLPAAFQHAIWLVAPPRHLPRGQNDLVGEMRSSSEGNSQHREEGWQGLAVDPEEEELAKRRDVHRALGRQGESPAWFNVRMGLFALLAAWGFLVFGFTVELITENSTQPSLLSAPGTPNNLRDPRYRPAKPGSSSPPPVGTGGAEAGPAKGVRQQDVARRLLELQEIGGQQSGLGEVMLGSGNLHEVADKLRALLPLLQQIASGSGPMPGLPQRPLPLPAASLAMAPQPQRAAVPWPSMFEPRMLACGQWQGRGGGAVTVALSKHGRGAVIGLPASGTGEGDAEMAAFALEGASLFGPLLAAHWDEAGLLLTASTGHLLECPGDGPANGRWRCRPMPGPKLPLAVAGKPFTGAVAVTRSLLDGTLAGEPRLRAAVVFPGEDSVTVLERSGLVGVPWLAAGEVRLRASVEAAAFAGHDELLLASADGSVARMQMGDGRLSLAVGAPAGHPGHLWRAACGLPRGVVARLGLRPASSAAAVQAWEPTLLLG